MPWCSAALGRSGGAFWCQTGDMSGIVRTLAIVDDHPAISEGVPSGLRSVLGEGFTVARHVRVADLIDDGRAYDVVLLDVNLDDGTDPVDNVRRVVAAGWPVLLYTQEQRLPLLGRCIRAGALGVVTKHQGWADLAEAITLAAQRKTYLSPTWAAALKALGGPDGRDGSVPELTLRESQILRLYAAGLPLRSVAERLGIKEETAREYLRRVRQKYSDAGRPAPTKTHLFQRAVQDGHLQENGLVTDHDE